MDTKILAQVPLFSDLPQPVASNLAARLPVVKLEKGDFLFHEGEIGDSFYIIISGSIEAVKGVGLPDEKIVNVIGKGEFLGEMSLLEPNGSRSASARAAERSQLWMVTRSEFNSLLSKYPSMIYAVMRVLSKRLSLTTDNTYNDLRKKNMELQEAYDQLKDAHLQILEKERLERELQVARNIQMSILPDRLPFLQDFDFGYKIEPARQVGGDFFDVLQLDEDTTAVFVGDVADKGVPSAIFMARAHALLTAESGLDVSPTSVLRRVNSHLTKMERSDQFVTVLYGILYRKTRLFKYARAGHEVPLLVMPEGQIHRMAHVNGMALGLFEDINLDEQVVRIPPGGTLLIYTDGMTDGRNPQGEPFGLARLQSTLGGLVGKPAQDTCDLLMETMTCYRAEVPQDDDVTLVAIHAG